MVYTVSMEFNGESVDFGLRALTFECAWGIRAKSKVGVKFRYPESVVLLEPDPLNGRISEKGRMFGRLLA